MKSAVTAEQPAAPLDKYSTFALIRDLARFVKPYRGRFALATALRVVSDVLRLYPGYALAVATTFLTTYQPGQPLGRLWLLLAGMAVTGVVASLASLAAGRIGFSVSNRVYIDTRLAALSHIVSLDIAWHHKDSSGSRIERINRGA